jgi:hypothetical protein
MLPRLRSLPPMDDTGSKRADQATRGCRSRMAASSGSLTDRKPSHFGKDAWSYEEGQLVDAQEIPLHVTEEIASIRNPELMRSEALSLDHGQVDCFVIRGQGKYRSGSPPDTRLEITFWIEKSSNFVRKIEEYWKVN